VRPLVDHRLLGMIPADHMDRLLNYVADKPKQMVQLARQLLARGNTKQAGELCERAIALAPNDPEVQIFASDVFSHNVPRWHIHILRDRARNGACEAALRRAVQPGCHVLEIGTGSGLFAMMAARAGAAQVVACERNSAVAAAAAEVIARNGLADRVRIVAKDSCELKIGIDLERPADVLIAELAANNMVGQGILPVMEHALRYLVQADARVIPCRGAVRVALAQDQQWDNQANDLVEGFDLSAFNRVAPPTYQIAAPNGRLTLRSEPGDLFNFDFRSGGPFPEQRSTIMLSSTGGLVNGIAQWIQIWLDDEQAYESFSSSRDFCAYGVLFYPWMRPVEMESGPGVIVCGSHDRVSLRIWTETYSGR
jgi:type III protein arginine methyltransferase